MSIKEKYRHLPPLQFTNADVQRLIQVLRRHSVRIAYLFGSVVRSPEQAQDIDLALLPGPNFSFPNFYADLSLALNTDRLDVVDLRRASSSLWRHILREGRCIFVSSQQETSRYEAGKILQFLEGPLPLTFRKEEDRAMSLDREFLTNTLETLLRTAQELGHYQTVSALDLESDLSLRWTVERGLLVGPTLIFQVAAHILHEVFSVTPSTYEGSLVELHRRGVISESLYRRLRGSGGFRNVLVHEYTAIDLELVAQAAQNAPKTFRDFVSEVQAWLNRRSPERERVLP